MIDDMNSDLKRLVGNRIARAVAEGSSVSAKWVDDTLRAALETP